MTMREKMAKAMAGRAAYVWDQMNDGERLRWFAYADAVLDALMEPTEGMMTSAAYSDISTSYGDEDSFEYVSAEDAGAIFAKMVRAAKEGK